MQQQPYFQPQFQPQPLYQQDYSNHSNAR
jgi:hypothetical protein